jgi:hypothetical protein
MVIYNLHSNASETEFVNGLQLRFSHLNETENFRVNIMCNRSVKPIQFTGMESIDGYKLLKAETTHVCAYIPRDDEEWISGEYSETKQYDIFRWHKPEIFSSIGLVGGAFIAIVIVVSIRHYLRKKKINNGFNQMPSEAGSPPPYNSVAPNDVIVSIPGSS